MSPGSIRLLVSRGVRQIGRIGPISPIIISQTPASLWLILFSHLCPSVFIRGSLWQSWRLGGSFPLSAQAKRCATGQVFVTAHIHLAGKTVYTCFSIQIFRPGLCHPGLIQTVIHASRIAG